MKLLEIGRGFARFGETELGGQGLQSLAVANLAFEALDELRLLHVIRLRQQRGP